MTRRLWIVYAVGTAVLMLGAWFLGHSMGDKSVQSKMTAIQVCQYVEQKLADSYRYHQDLEYPNVRLEYSYQAVSARQITPEDEGMWVRNTFLKVGEWLAQVQRTTQGQVLQSGKWVTREERVDTLQYRFDETTAALERIE